MSTTENVQSLKDDSKALADLAKSILRNKRLAWMIVSLWLQKNHYVMVDDPNPTA